MNAPDLDPLLYRLRDASHVPSADLTAAVAPLEWRDQLSSLSLNPSQKPLFWTAAVVVLAALTA